jgi:hypothetical protein
LHLPFFVIRGTCDYCNPDKNDEWQHYAAIAAAAFTLAILEVTALPEVFGHPRFSYPPVQAPTEGSAVAIEMPPSIQTAISPHLNALNDYSSLLLEATLGRIGRIRCAVDTLEYVVAINQADELALWITKHRDSLPSTLLESAFLLLARIAMIKASRVSESGSPLDLTEAEFYFGEARRVGTL